MPICIVAKAGNRRKGEAREGARWGGAVGEEGDADNLRLRNLNSRY